MLNPFPIQFLSFVAYFIFRVFVGFVLIRFGFKHISELQEHHTAQPKILLWSITLLELLAGTMFILGFYVQIASILVGLLSFCYRVVRKTHRAVFVPEKLFNLLLIGSALLLFITGAGAFAFDLPI